MTGTVDEYRRAVQRTLIEFQAMEELMKVLLGARYELLGRLPSATARRTRADLERLTLGQLAGRFQIEFGAGPGTASEDVWLKRLIKVRNYCAHRAYILSEARIRNQAMMREDTERMQIVYGDIREWMHDLHGLLAKEAKALGVTVQDLRELNAPQAPW